MSENKQTVEAYMDAFGKPDHPRVLECLTDEGFTGSPDIKVTRLTEEGDVVVAEGTVRAQKTDGTVMDLAFCDVFEMRDAKIRRLVSYLVVAQ